MGHYGARRIAPNWFTSYLSNRKQYVSVNGHTSEYLNSLWRFSTWASAIFDIHTLMTFPV